MKASDLFVHCLEEEGIEYIFGIPGEENADFMMSLEKSETIRFILTRHEQGAAFMAEIYGRLTGNPAGCLGTLGPGATNLITGVADANMDRAPMLVLTGQGASTRLHKESHQIMDVVSMFEPVTKWAMTVLHQDTIPEIVRKAVRVARTEKPGACLIELPEDIAKLETDMVPMQPKRFRRPVAGEKVVDQAFELIRNAKRPYIIAGNGCIRKRASKQLRIFCEKTGIGAISTFMAKGSVDMDADYCLYTIGLQARDVVEFGLEQADLIITLGYDMVEYPPRLWNATGGKKIIHADFLPAEIDSHYHPDVEVIGDLAHTLWMLNECVDRAGGLNIDSTMQASLRQTMQDEFAEHRDDDTKGSVRPQKVLWDVRQAMGGFCTAGSNCREPRIPRAQDPGYLWRCRLPDECAGDGNRQTPEFKYRGDGLGRPCLRPDCLEAGRAGQATGSKTVASWPLCCGRCSMKRVPACLLCPSITGKICC